MPNGLKLGIIFAIVIGFTRRLRVAGSSNPENDGPCNLAARRLTHARPNPEFAGAIAKGDCQRPWETGICGARGAQAPHMPIRNANKRTAREFLGAGN